MHFLRCLVLGLFYLFCGSSYAEEYLIQPGDELTITIPGEEAFSVPFTVNRDGDIHLPEIGRVRVAGVYEEELPLFLTEFLANVYRDLTGLDAFVAKKQMLIFVSGYVKEPGEYVIPRSATIQTALQYAGGLRSGAQINKLQLRRLDTQIYFDYKSYLDSGDTSQLPRLRAMDELFVPASPIIGNVEMEFDPAKIPDSGDAARDNTAIKVFGEVKSPGSFSFRHLDRQIVPFH